MMLFVTHYPPLADLERLFPSHVANYHMSFLLHDKEGKHTYHIHMFDPFTTIHFHVTIYDLSHLWFTCSHRTAKSFADTVQEI